MWPVAHEPADQTVVARRDGATERQYGEDMPLIDLTVKHGQTLEEARRRLAAAVRDVTERFGAVVSRVEWAADGNRVKLEGRGIWVEMWVDARDVHATGDIPILGALLGAPLGGAVLGAPLGAGLRQILE